MEPREVYAMVDGDARRFSRLAELFAWGVWLMIAHIPLIKFPQQHLKFYAWLRAHTPPGFIPPNKR